MVWTVAVTAITLAIASPAALAQGVHPCEGPSNSERKQHKQSGRQVISTLAVLDCMPKVCVWRAWRSIISPRYIEKFYQVLMWVYCASGEGDEGEQYLDDYSVQEELTNSSANEAAPAPMELHN